MAKILHDYFSSSTDRKRPWAKHKRDSLKYANRVYDILSAECPYELKRAYNIYSCGDHLEFKESGDTLVLYKAYFCKDRFCALCQWRRMLKNTYQMTKTIERSIEKHPSSRFLFLTLTVKNVKSDEIRASLQSMNRAFAKMTKWARVKQNLIGFIRSAEVTVNRKHETYHPHLHVILQVKSSYFKNKSSYIKQTEWQALWRKAMNLSYDPQVSISIVKPKDETKTSEASAVAEVAKYTVKPADYLSNNQEQDKRIIKALRREMYNMRMVSYGLELRSIHQELFKNDDENGDLVNVGDTTAGATAKTVVAEWSSKFKNYVIVEHL